MAESKRSPQPPILKPALTPEQAALLAWTNLRNAHFQSGFTGLLDGEELPNLGRRPPDPPRPQRKRSCP